jgi:hypothetical protein
MNAEPGNQTTTAPGSVDASTGGSTVTCRPNDYCLAAADILVKEGVCLDHSAAITWLCEARLESHHPLFFRTVEIAGVAALRQQAVGVTRVSAG